MVKEPPDFELGALGPYRSPGRLRAHRYARADPFRGKASKFPGPSQVQARTRTSPRMDWSPERTAEGKHRAEFQLDRVLARALLF